MIPLRLRLVSTDVLAAAALVGAVVIVSPSNLSHTYALIVIATSVLPGLMLTGDVKMLNAGVGGTVSNLRFKVITSAAFNLPIGAVSAWLLEQRPSITTLAILVLVAALGATAQAFSSVWYYTQPDKSKVFSSKAAASGVKVAFAGIAMAQSELTFVLLGMTLGAILEFGLNFRSLPWEAKLPVAKYRNVVAPLGFAYGVSRVVSAAIRLGLGQLFGSLIASFLIVEQLVGGANSVFEKYFLRRAVLRRTSQAMKVVYLLVMVAAVPWITEHPPVPESRTSLLWLALVACAGLLPLAEMYTALQRRGQNFVALGSTIVSVVCGAGLALAALHGDLANASLVAYVALPCITFLFYWIAGINVHHNPKH